MAFLSQTVFVTGNAKKLSEVRNILGPIESVHMDIPELQETPENISKQKARFAFNVLKRPVLVEDTCLAFNALGGMPGPYIKWFSEAAGNQGLLNMIKACEDKTAYAICTFSYYDGNAEPLVFRGEIKGVIIEGGECDFGWDSIFQPEGYNIPFSEMSFEQKNSISHRCKALHKVKAHFNL